MPHDRDFVSRTLAHARAVRDLARRARALHADLGDDSPECLMTYAAELDAYAVVLEAVAAKAGACGPAA